MPVLIITVCYGLMILRLKSVRMLSGSQVKRNLFILYKHEPELVHIVRYVVYFVPEAFNYMQIGLFKHKH